jgi:3-oxoacyl-[acyl-carrier protein] reductase
MRRRGRGQHPEHHGHLAIQPIRELGLSVATWSGVIGYAKTLSLELGEFGINVNTICPGYIDTSRLRKVFASGTESSESVQDRLPSKSPMRRIGHGGTLQTWSPSWFHEGLVHHRDRDQVDGAMLRGVR